MPHGHCCVLAQEATVDHVQGRHIDFAPIISLIPFGPLIPTPTCLPVPLQGVNFRALIDLGRSDNFLSAGICDLLRLSRYPLKELLTMQLADGGYAFIDKALFFCFSTALKATLLLTLERTVDDAVGRRKLHIRRVLHSSTFEDWRVKIAQGVGNYRNTFAIDSGLFILANFSTRGTTGRPASWKLSVEVSPFSFKRFLLFGPLNNRPKHQVGLGRDKRETSEAEREKGRE